MPCRKDSSSGQGSTCGLPAMLMCSTLINIVNAHVEPLPVLLNNSPGEVNAQKVPWVSLAEESLARHFAQLKVSLAFYTTALICKYKSDLGKQCKNRAMVFEG